MLRTLIISFCCLCSLSLTAETITGLCGDSLHWSFDTETAHMEITGTGKMNLTKYPAWTNQNITMKSVKMAYGITSIDAYAFEEQALTEVIVPASVKKFGRNAFAQMPSLLHFEYQGYYIYAQTGEQILHNCYNLRYFQGITRMLSYNEALDTVVVTYGSAHSNFWGPTYINNHRAYDKYLYGKYSEDIKTIQTYIFPNDLEIIGDYYLCNATDLEGITIPAYVHTIGKNAFLNCTSMDSVIFKGDTIHTIADSAFCNCTNLSYIRLIDTIPPTIYEHTFEHVNRSMEVHVPVQAVDTFKNAPYWSEFMIRGIGEQPTSTNNTPSPTTSTEKILYKGQLFIIHNNKYYNILGK